jgi:hypothetical protein
MVFQHVQLKEKSGIYLSCGVPPHAVKGKVRNISIHGLVLSCESPEVHPLFSAKNLIRIRYNWISPF